MLLTHPWPIARPFIAGGVHTISLERLWIFRSDQRNCPVCGALRDSKETGELALLATRGCFAEFSPRRNASVSLANEGVGEFDSTARNQRDPSRLIMCL